MKNFWQNLLGDTFNTSDHRPLHSNVIYPLDNYCFIEVVGPDAEKFLQGQLSCDIRKLNLTQSGLGSHSTPKGRMLSSFRICKNAENSFLLRVEHSIAERALAALNKYIVFSKAKASINENIIAFGLHGEQASKNIQQLWPDISIADYHQSIQQNQICLVSSEKLLGFEVYCDLSYAEQYWQTLTANLTVSPATQHTLLENQLGLAFINAASFEQFTPQSYNYQLTPAISFNKGCYTGQEIVARLHYLGKLKRHSYHYHVETEATLATADEVSLPESDKNIGHILSAVNIGEQRWDVLINLVEEHRTIDLLKLNHKQLKVVKRLPIDYEKAATNE